MAVNMNKRECLQIGFLVFLVVNASLFVVNAATTTTPSITPTNATTTTSTTQIITTPTAATTTITPRQPSAIDSNSLLGQCPCDLTGNACDVNCCCDADCTTLDKQTFSTCLPYATDVDDKLCFRKEIILFENSDPIVSKVTDDGLFCIYFDNKAERNYYTNPDLVNIQSTFNEYQKQFSAFSFQSSPITTANLSAPFYKSGDPIYTVSASKAIGMLGLPRSLTSSDCVDGNSVGHLINETYSCTRRLIQNACSNTPSLNAKNYIDGFRVVKSPKMFQEFNITVGTGGAYDLFNNSYTTAITTLSSMIYCFDSTSGQTALCTRSDVPSPNLVNNTCRDVVREVHYTIHVAAGTSGISSVSARFVLQNVSNADVTLPQTFSSSFALDSARNAFERSGNPGYVVGQPVLAGTLNQTTDTILINANRDRYMTVVKPSATGYCDSDTNRAPVLYGQEYRSGCLLNVSAGNLTEYCALMQQKIISTMEFDSVPEIVGTTFRDPNRYVGIYGNSDRNKTGDWVKVIYQNRLRPMSPQAGSSSCQLTLGMHIQILYANIGALVNPQPKIIGVSFTYDTPKLVQIRPTLVGEYNQPIEITSSVTFIDVSKPAVNYRGDPPVFLAKVPYDFFYPFISGASTLWSVSTGLTFVTVFATLVEIL